MLQHETGLDFILRLLEQVLHNSSEVVHMFGASHSTPTPYGPCSALTVVVTLQGVPPGLQQRAADRLRFVPGVELF